MELRARGDRREQEREEDGVEKRPQQPGATKQEKKIWRLQAAFLILAVSSAGAVLYHNALFFFEFNTARKYGDLGLEPKLLRAALYEFFLVASWRNYCQVIVNTLLGSCFIAAVPFVFAVSSRFGRSGILGRVLEPTLWVLFFLGFSLCTGLALFFWRWSKILFRGGNFGQSGREGGKGRARRTSPKRAWTTYAAATAVSSAILFVGGVFRHNFVAEQGGAHSNLNARIGDQVCAPWVWESNACSCFASSSSALSLF